MRVFVRNRIAIKAKVDAHFFAGGTELRFKLYTQPAAQYGDADEEKYAGNSLFHLHLLWMRDLSMNKDVMITDRQRISWEGIRDVC
jgi:hypothetical protein